MRATIRRKLSMARRALDFANAHPVDDPGFKIALAQLDAAVTRATQLGLQETGGKSGEHSAVARRRVARSRIRREFLVRIVRVGHLAAQENPDLVGLFNLPRFEAPNKQFLLEAHALLDNATLHAAILIPHGLGEDLTTRLGAAIAQLESIGSLIDSGREDHVGAVGGFGAALATCRTMVSVVDTYYVGAHPAGSEVLAGWDSARKVEGPFRHRNDATSAPSQGPEQAPAPAVQAP